MINASQGCKGISFACWIGFSVEEGCDEFGRVWNQCGRMRVDGGDGEDGVLSNVGMTMLEAGSS